MAQLLEGNTVANGAIIIEGGKGAVNIDGSIVRLAGQAFPLALTIGTGAGNIGSISAIGSSVLIYRTGTTLTPATGNLTLAGGAFTGDNVVLQGGKGTVEVLVTGDDDGPTQEFTLNLSDVTAPLFLEQLTANGNVTVTPVGSSRAWVRTA